MGLVRAQKKANRRNLELSHHQEQELAAGYHSVAEDKAGRCYTYRGVQYCYN